MGCSFIPSHYCRIFSLGEHTKFTYTLLLIETRWLLTFHYSNTPAMKSLSLSAVHVSEFSRHYIGVELLGVKLLAPFIFMRLIVLIPKYDQSLHLNLILCL